MTPHFFRVIDSQGNRVADSFDAEECIRLAEDLIYDGPKLLAAEVIRMPEGKPFFRVRI